MSDEHAENGGFPEPVAGEPVRLLAARHPGCGRSTRIRVPQAVPARAVRRVRCIGCAQEFDAETVEELGAPPTRPPRRFHFGGLSLPRPSLPPLPAFDPSSRGWRLLSIPLAAALVIGCLLLVQGGDDDAPAVGESSAARQLAAPPPTTPRAERQPGGELARPAENARIVSGSSFELALPAGWEKIDPPSGATFAAVSADGSADATLWIEEKPELDFPSFISRSLTQIEAFTGRPAEIRDRVAAPTAEQTVVHLAADSPPGEPTYEVLLRAAGPYRYYLATTVEPDASGAAADGVELIDGSFTPDPSAVATETE